MGEKERRQSFVLGLIYILLIYLNILSTETEQNIDGIFALAVALQSFILFVDEAEQI